MSRPFARRIDLSRAPLIKRQLGQGALTSLDLDITARCNNNCTHCYINLPPGDRHAKSKELSREEIDGIADEAISLGAMLCTLTGGEPLLRDDFADIYLSLKKKGLLTSVFTNAALVTKELAGIFSRYPPRNMEVSVYGVTQQTYEAVTRKPGSFAAFVRGVEALLSSGVKVRFKAMALRSNIHELPAIAQFCRKRTRDYFRFDPWLHFRYDGNRLRNEEMVSERLSPEDFVNAERGDSERISMMQAHCEELLMEPRDPGTGSVNVFSCGAGKNSCSISYDGVYRLCGSLWHPDCVYDLRNGNLAEAHLSLMPRVRSMKSSNEEFMRNCYGCPIINFCSWCPARAYLETGQLDQPVAYFCEVGHARARALGIDP